MIRVKNIILPYEALSNFDLIEASKDLKIKCFRGVYLLDTMPGKPNKKECGILNLDSTGGPGTHWVAWFKNGKNKIYFDSYGIQPPKEVIKYLGKGINYNSRVKTRVLAHSQNSSFHIVRSSNLRFSPSVPFFRIPQISKSRHPFKI